MIGRDGQSAAGVPSVGGTPSAGKVRLGPGDRSDLFSMSRSADRTKTIQSQSSPAHRTFAPSATAVTTPTAPESRDRSQQPPAFRTVIDFDGTLVVPNVAILLVEEFAAGGRAVAHEIDRKLHRGSITLREAWQYQASLLPGDRLDEMRAFVRERVPLRPGARSLLALLDRHGVPATIVSGGLDFYIREVLDRENLDLPVRSDRMRVLAGGEVEVIHPFEHPTCRLCGICKAGVTAASDGGPPTVFIADGATDRYGAETAGIVFARGRLLDHCRKSGIPCWPFGEDFEPVTEQLTRWLEGRDAVPAPRRRGLAGTACPISAELFRGDSPTPA